MTDSNSIRARYRQQGKVPFNKFVYPHEKEELDKLYKRLLKRRDKDK